MKRLMVVSKNDFLLDFISTSDFEVFGFNGRLIDWFDNETIDVVIYDGSTYGPLPPAIFRTLPIVILDTYRQQLLVEQHVSERPFAYLLIENFLDEFHTAIEWVCRGENYFTNKLVTT